MVTTIPRVKVSRTESGGHAAICTCGWRVLRPHRYGADQAALTHEASHATPDPADQIDDMDGWAP